MSDTNRADSSTEFSEAWKEDVAAQSQPDEGRPAADDDLGGDGTGGADLDADKDPPAGEPQTTDADADLPAGDAEISDEWAGLTPEQLRDRAIAAEERARRAENTLRSNEGRFSRAERELNEFRIRQQQQPKPETDAPKPEPVDVDALLSTVRDEYPGIGENIATAITALRSQVDELRTARASEAEIRATQEQLDTQEFLGRQEQLLTEKHPNWRDVVKTPEYAQWASAAPRFIQELIVRNGEALVDGEAAVEVFNRFASDTKPKDEPDPQQSRRQRQLEGNRNVQVRNPAVDVSAAPGSGDFKSEWERAAAEERRQSAAK